MTEPAAHYVRVAPDDHRPDLLSLAPFKAVVIIDAEYSEKWQNEISGWLVESGCRYMMAWGPSCSSWDDSVDRADLEARNFKNDDEKFVMTTWHEDESLESVFWFSQFCANFSYADVELLNTVILHIGHEDRRLELLDLFEQSRTLTDREPEAR